MSYGHLKFKKRKHIFLLDTNPQVGYKVPVNKRETLGNDISSLGFEQKLRRKQVRKHKVRQDQQYDTLRNVRNF